MKLEPEAEFFPSDSAHFVKWIFLSQVSKSLNGKMVSIISVS